MALSASVVVTYGKDEKGLSAKEAQRIILSVPGTGLSKGAVLVKEVTTTGAEAEALAEVRAAFRLRKRGDEVMRAAGGGWSVAEVRVGDRQWEDVDLVVRALRTERGAPLLSDVESLAADLEERQKARKEKEERENEEQKGKEQENKAATPADESELLRRGAVTARSLTSLLSSSAVETSIEARFRFTRDGKRWRLASVRVGEGGWLDVAGLLAALDAEKSARARAELATVVSALEAFRRERGFYVVAEDQRALVDHLNPRYLTQVIRIDPWHRPYRYRGTRESFVLSSDGADGKEGTADDVTLNGRT